MGTRFDWDDAKARTNLAKHGVSLEEARTIFFDPLFAMSEDPEHSEMEERFLGVGRSERGRLLVVSFAERHDPAGALIRIISGWRATRAERQVYEEA